VVSLAHWLHVSQKMTMPLVSNPDHQDQWAPHVVLSSNSWNEYARVRHQPFANVLPVTVHVLSLVTVVHRPLAKLNADAAVSGLLQCDISLCYTQL
jgi:hypothetical protein